MSDPGDVLDHNLTNHPPRDDSIIARFEVVRGHAKNLGRAIISECPATRERSLALTNLEQATMWAIGSIARHQEDLV